MTYIVITGNNRKEFEKISQAVSYSTVQSRIYQRDAFGNLTPLNNEQIQDLLRIEPSDNLNPDVRNQKIQTGQPVQQTSGADKKNLVNYKQVEKKENVDIPEKKKKHFNFQFILYIIYFILIALIVYVAYRIIAPYWEEFVGISTEYGLD